MDVDSLQLVRPRWVGVEHVGLAALGWLELPRILEEAGFNGIQQAAALGSELATWRWLQERSGLGELLEVDFEAMPLMILYRASDLLVRRRQAIEAALFSLPATVTLYDLTNIYFEGEMAGLAKARRGHSQEKRSDCTLVTLGLAGAGRQLTWRVAYNLLLSKFKSFCAL